MSLETAIVSRAQAGMRPTDIARDLKCARHTVYCYLWKSRVDGLDIPNFKRGMKTGSLTVVFDPQIRASLLPHAARRGVEAGEIVTALITCALGSGLIDAILDDLDQEDAA